MNGNVTEHALRKSSKVINTANNLVDLRGSQPQRNEYKPAHFGEQETEINQIRAEYVNLLSQK